MIHDLISSLSASPSGLLCVRRTGEGYIAVGVLHFPHSFRPEEATAYPLLINDASGMSIVPVALHQMPQEHRSGGMSNWATMSNWPVLEGAVPARFAQAFPGGEGWSTLTVSEKDPFEGVLPETDRAGTHYWVSVMDGCVQRCDPPCLLSDLVGQAVSGLFRNFAVWPDKNGKPHTLPVHCSDIAKLMQINSAIDALEGLGKIQPEVSRELHLGCPVLHDVGSAGRSDPLYLSYLGELWKRGGVNVEGAYTAEGLAARRVRSDKSLEVVRKATEATTTKDGARPSL